MSPTETKVRAFVAAHPALAKKVPPCTLHSSGIIKHRNISCVDCQAWLMIEMIKQGQRELVQFLEQARNGEINMDLAEAVNYVISTQSDPT
jgi:hypothetical protein